MSLATVTSLWRHELHSLVVSITGQQ